MNVRLAIDFNNERAIYVQIMDEVRRALVIGSIGAEDPLPSVRQMAADLRLNPNTVAQAYRELEREGVVYVRRGHGTFITGNVSVAAERKSLLAEVARRALIDAHRHGIGSEALLDAIREASDADQALQTGTRP